MFIVNYGQTRLARDWQHTLTSGRDWSLTASSDTYIDPITQTGMLVPIPLTAGFRTSATGVNARLRKSDTDKSSSTDWIEIQRGFAGNYYMHSQAIADNDSARRVHTTDTYSRNRGFYLSYFSYNYGGDDYVQLECGWIAGTDQIELRVWSSGQVEVWKNNQFAGSHTLRGDRDGSEESPDQTLPNREVKLLMIPCRRRSLLVLTNQGSGFEHIFEDLDPDDPDNTITPAAAQFYCYIPLGQATFQFAPVRYATSGKLLTEIQTLRVPPPTGTTVSATAFIDSPGYGTTSATSAVRLPDDSGDFAADDTSTNYRGRVSLTGDGTASRWVYGLQVTVDGETALTDDSPTTLDNYTRTWSLNVDSRARATVELELQELNALELVVPNLRRQAYLPIKVEQAGVVWLEGVGSTTAWRESTQDKLRRGSMQIADLSKLLEVYLYRDEFALDGLAFEDALTALLTYAGIDPAIINLPATGYQLPTQIGASRSDFALRVSVGDSAWRWIQKLHEQYGADRLYGFRPTTMGIEFFSERWDDLPTTPKATLYETRAAAILAGEPEGNYRAWYRRLESETIEAEANEIIVTGWDSTTRRPIQSSWVNSAAQDPTTPVASRPANWSGFPVRFGWVDTSITTLQQAESVRDYFVDRLTNPRETATWECAMLFDSNDVPVWVGDVVELNAHGLYRVTEFRAQHRHIDYARAVYSGEKIEP